jgi:cytochrome P450
MSANVTAKNFIPFGAGMTSCAGADFSKVLMGVFFHVMVTKYRLLILTYYLHAFVPHRQVEQN